MNRRTGWRAHRELTGLLFASLGRGEGVCVRSVRLDGRLILYSVEETSDEVATSSLASAATMTATAPKVSASRGTLLWRGDNSCRDRGETLH